MLKSVHVKNLCNKEDAEWNRDSGLLTGSLASYRRKTNTLQLGAAVISDLLLMNGQHPPSAGSGWNAANFQTLVIQEMLFQPRTHLFICQGASADQSHKKYGHTVF